MLKIRRKMFCFYASYCWDCVLLWLKTPTKIQHFSIFLHFCGLTSSEIYWCVFRKKNVFFSTFFGASSCEFDQKNQFLKNEKNFVKNLKKRPFFARLRAERCLCQHPVFEGPLFEYFHKVNDQNEVIQKFGFKGYPLYSQNFWTRFWPLLRGYFLNSEVLKKSWFEGSEFEQNFRLCVHHTGEITIFQASKHELKDHIL